MIDRHDEKSRLVLLGLLVCPSEEAMLAGGQAGRHDALINVHQAADSRAREFDKHAIAALYAAHLHMS
jgi:hypothetical protein